MFRNAYHKTSSIMGDPEFFFVFFMTFGMKGGGDLSHVASYRSVVVKSKWNNWKIFQSLWKYLRMELILINSTIQFSSCGVDSMKIRSWMFFNIWNYAIPGCQTFPPQKAFLNFFWLPPYAQLPNFRKSTPVYLRILRFKFTVKIGVDLFKTENKNLIR